MELETLPCLRFSRAFSFVNLFHSKLRRNRVAILAVLPLAIGMTSSAPAARAQGVTFAWAQTTVVRFHMEQSEGPSPFGMAVDSNGDIFVFDATAGNDFQVKEIMAVNGSVPANPAVRVVFTASGDFYPGGLATDGSGDLFIADTNSGVLEVLAVDGVIPDNPAVRTVFTTSEDSPPQGVATDGSGNLYIAEEFLGVAEVLAVDGVIPDNPTVRTVFTASGDFYPSGLATDGSGDLFIANREQVEELVAVNGAVPSNPTIRILSTSISLLNGLGVDPSGNVFVATYDTSSLVQEIVAVDGSVPSNPTIKSLGSGRVRYRSIAVDQKGNVFATLPGSDDIDTDFQVGGVAELQLGSVNFGNVDVCPAGQTGPPCSSTITLTYNVANGTTIGAVNILTAGAKNLDFQAETNDDSDTLCSTQTNNSATTCTVDVTLAPLATGLRNGTVQILDGIGNILATTNIYGTGVGSGPGGMPVAKVSPTALQFGTSPFGSESQPLPITVTNIGTGVLNFSPSINGASYTVVSSTCEAGVTAGNSCTLQVSFDPLAVSSHVDILTLHTNGTSDPTIFLEGIASGVGPTMETPLDFGTIPHGTTKVLPLTIKNVGVPGTVLPEAQTNDPSYKILTTSGNTCLAGISAGQSCTLPVEFDPANVGKYDNDFVLLFPSAGPVRTFAILKGAAD
jgi:sugar lactone lactonase YvrE